ncbi:ATP-binding protein [bacterium]|nr:MAG: ATP-binding protein [bacterium]QQR62135.1 MAG: ATP-binding protein [bacterium]QQR63307.1 MAG: ATP-binding protein [bacterium]
MLQQIGYVIGGSITQGLSIRLLENDAHDSIKTGKFVCIIAGMHRFFSLITDLTLHTTQPEIGLFPPTQNEQLLLALLKRKYMYIVGQAKPLIMVDQAYQLWPVKMLPTHFSPVVAAQEADMELIFGKEGDSERKYFAIGKPLDMHTPICIDLEKLTERSNGIFGKTGTGKTFITRLILAGLIKNQKAALLIFDMHSEYGIQARTEKAGTQFVKGLKSLFGNKVAICSLDPHATRRRGVSPDIELTFSYDSVHVEDILSLQYELNLHTTAVEVAHLIAAQYKQNWLATLLSQGSQLKEFAASLGAHPESIAALYRKLKRIESLPFFTPEPKPNVIDAIMSYLDQDISIIIEFGNFNSSFVYLLIANIITRRIHQSYIHKTEQFLGGYTTKEPRKLMICIEEAHKFLNMQASKQTIFGTIAREMRKYYVSLLVVDQRPSGIDQEILSQIGTKIIAQMHDEQDIQAVLTGMPNAQNLRTVLSSLDSKQQALVIGHAITMPVVVHTRSYDQQFYQQMTSSVAHQSVDELINELF